MAVILETASFRWSGWWCPYTRNNVSTLMPRYPAACHGSVPFCINHVAAVCRSVCGETPGPSLASVTACLNAVFTEDTPSPLNSTKCRAIILRSFQRRKIDKGTPDSRGRRCRRNGARACPAIDPDKDEPGEMAEGPPVRFDLLSFIGWSVSRGRANTSRSGGRLHRESAIDRRFGPMMDWTES